MAIYPIGFAIMLSSSIYVLNAELLPTLTEISPPENWTGALGFLYGISVYFSGMGDNRHRRHRFNYLDGLVTPALASP